MSEDLAQETFIKAWRKADRFHERGSYGGWLLRIAWNTYLSSSRGKIAHVDYPEEAARSQNPATTIDVERALASLTAKERAAALLCYSDGYSHAEAAAILEWPVGTLKSIVARARRKLAEMLGES